MSSCNHSVIKPKSSFFQNSSSSDTKVKRACTIECVLVRDDGQQVPIQIDHNKEYAQTEKTLTSIEIQTKLHAETKRNELRDLLNEHQKLVNDIQQMELVMITTKLSS